jgi:hypothetical protein
MPAPGVSCGEKQRRINALALYVRASDRFKFLRGACVDTEWVGPVKCQLGRFYIPAACNHPIGKVPGLTTETQRALFFLLLAQGYWPSSAASNLGKSDYSWPGFPSSFEILPVDCTLHFLSTRKGSDLLLSSLAEGFKAAVLVAKELLPAEWMSDKLPGE